jgi:HEAT repeat protein
MLRLVALLLSFSCLVPAAVSGTDAPWQILTEGTTNANANKRKKALSALTLAAPNPRAVTLAESLLTDKEVDVRQSAASVLGDMKSRAAIPKLVEALDDDAPEVSFVAARSLWNLGDKRGKAILLAVLAGDRGVSAGFMRGSMRDAKNRLRNPSSLAMLGLKEGAGMLFGPAAMGISAIEEMRKDSSVSARVLAAVLLGTDGSPESVKALEEALVDKNWVVRAAVVKSLAMRGDRKQIATLQSMLTDQEEAVRYMAAAGVIRLQAAGRKRAADKVEKHHWRFLSALISVHLRPII